MAFLYSIAAIVPLLQLRAASFAQQTGAGKFGVFQNFNQFFTNAFGNPQQQQSPFAGHQLTGLYGNYFPPTSVQNPSASLYSNWYSPFGQPQQQQGRTSPTTPAVSGRGATTKPPKSSPVGSNLITSIIDYYALPWPNTAPLFTVADQFFADPYWQKQLLKLNVLPQLLGGVLSINATNEQTANISPQTVSLDSIAEPDQQVVRPSGIKPAFVINPIHPTVVDPFARQKPAQTTTTESFVSNGEAAAPVRPEISKELSTTFTTPTDSVTINSEHISDSTKTSVTGAETVDGQTTPRPESTPPAEVPAVGTGEDKSTQTHSSHRKLPGRTTTTTTTPNPASKAHKSSRPKPNDCKTNPTDSVCYHFSKQRANLIDAVEQCRKRHMVLAHANENNTDFLNKLVDDSLPIEKSNCSERITIVANWTPFMRYGSYAFLYGNAQPECNFAEKQPFQSCSKDFDCTLVDWTRPAYFICAAETDTSDELSSAAAKLKGEAKRNIVQRTVQDELCMWSAHKTDFFEYLVSCEPIRPPAESSADAASGSKVIELPQFPARCMPIDYGDFFGESSDALIAARKILKQDKISFWTSTVNANVGQLKQCTPNCEDKDADRNSYVICRREIIKKTALPRFFQEWHDRNGAATVPYILSPEFNKTKKETILGFVNKLANNSCLRFQEVPQDKAPPSFLHILRDESPATCRGTVVGFVPGRALLSLGEQCFGLPVSIQRLLLQISGIPAEQNRYDRDEHIKVNFDNINPEPIYKLNYEKQPLPGLLQLNTPYDFFTVAHYPPWVYAEDKNVPVFEPIVKQINGRKIDIDKNRELSDGDKAKLKVLYGKSC